MSIMETITIKPDHLRDFTGCVLSTREYNGYHDSDFYATVWDEEAGCVREIEDGTTRAYAPSKYHRADASDEVRAKARAWYASSPDIRKGAKVRLERAFSAIRVGDTVEVVAGRKIAKGTVGEVVWVGRDNFNPKAFRVGLRLAFGGLRVFTAMGNVEKRNYNPPTEAEIDAEVARCNPY
jgi:ribosomal protein L24